MNLRPANMELAKACTKTDTCHKCEARLGCPIRYTFYVDDVDFEVNLQLTECDLQKLMDEKTAYTLTHSLRMKRTCELRDYREFSFI